MACGGRAGNVTRRRRYPGARDRSGDERGVVVDALALVMRLHVVGALDGRRARSSIYRRPDRPARLVAILHPAPAVAGIDARSAINVAGVIAVSVRSAVTVGVWSAVAVAIPIGRVVVISAVVIPRTDRRAGDRRTSQPQPDSGRNWRAPAPAASKPAGLRRSSSRNRQRARQRDGGDDFASWLQHAQYPFCVPPSW